MGDADKKSSSLDPGATLGLGAISKTRRASLVITHSPCAISNALKFHPFHNLRYICIMFQQIIIFLEKKLNLNVQVMKQFINVSVS